MKGYLILQLPAQNTTNQKQTRHPHQCSVLWQTQCKCWICYHYTKLQRYNFVVAGFTHGPSWCWGLNILDKLHQCNGYWSPVSLRCKIICSHGFAYVIYSSVMEDSNYQRHFSLPDDIIQNGRPDLTKYRGNSSINKHWAWPAWTGYDLETLLEWCGGMFSCSWHPKLSTKPS